MTDKFETSFSNLFSLHTPQSKQSLKEGKTAKSFRLFFSNNHFIPKSYKSSLHYSTNNENLSNKLTTLSTYQKSDEKNYNNRPSLAFIKKLKLSTSKLKNLANQYQKKLNEKLNDENFEGRKKFVNPNDSKNEKDRKNDLSKELSAGKVLQKFINKDDPQVKNCFIYYV